jgi:hypothetical protein
MVFDELLFLWFNLTALTPFPRNTQFVFISVSLLMVFHHILLPAASCWLPINLGISAFNANLCKGLISRVPVQLIQSNISRAFHLKSTYNRSRYV